MVSKFDFYSERKIPDSYEPKRDFLTWTCIVIHYGADTVV